MASQSPIDKQQLFKIIVWFMTAVVCGMALFPIIGGFPLIVTIIWSGFCGLFLFMLHGVIYKKVKRKYDIINNGLKGTATIISIIEHPEFRGQFNTSDYFVTMNLLIQFPGKIDSTIEKKERVTTSIYQKLGAGSIIPLRKGFNEMDEIIFLMDEISLAPNAG